MIKILVIIIVLLVITDLLFLYTFCSISEKIDSRRKKKTGPNDSSTTETGERVGSQIEKKDKTTFKINVKRKIWGFFSRYGYGWMRYSVIQTGKIPSFFIRSFFYKHIFRMKITGKTVINGGCEIRSPWNISADNCIIGLNCVLDGRRGIVFGEHVVLGSNVHIWTEEHSINDPYFSVLEENAQPVIIEQRAWICSNSSLLPGVHIGEGVVVASGAVVTKDCEAFTVYGGVPARKISTRNRNLKYVLSGKPHWGFY